MKSAPKTDATKRARLAYVARRKAAGDRLAAVWLTPRMQSALAALGGSTESAINRLIDATAQWQRHIDRLRGKQPDNERIDEL